MAALWIDGFDHYGPPGENNPSPATLLMDDYQVAHATNDIVPSLNIFGGGALQIFNLTNYGLAKTGMPIVSRLIGGFRFSSNLTTATVWAIELQRSAVSNCSIVLDGPTAQLSLRTGNRTGSVVDTMAGALLSGSIHYLEWDITFGASSPYTIYLDGIAIMSGTGNTGNGHTNCDGFTFFTGGVGATLQIDDFYLFDTTGSVNNAPLLTGPVVATQYPISDAQTQWTNDGNVITPAGILQTGVSSTSTANNAPGADQLALLQFIPAVNCSLASVGIFPQQTASGAHLRAVLYSDASGSPGSLIATGDEVTGTTASTALLLPFATGQALTAGTPYWLGYITDTSVALFEYDSSLLGQKKANTYSGGAPGSGSGMTIHQPTWEIWGNCTGATSNFASVFSNPVNGDGPANDHSTINSSVVGHEDLYNYPNLPGTVTAVYSVAVKAHVKRSDSGPRTIDLHTKSGSTDGTGSAPPQTPGTAYGWQTSFFDSDPDTSAAWSGAAAVNAATHGIKIAS